jgi:Na+/H+ antiporter NhaD/arsenite permease-like protein
VIEAVKNIHLFEIIAKQIVVRFHTTRNAITALVFITFLGSMVLTNDMALLTFLPLGFFVLSSTNKMNYLAFTFVMQNMAANLGGMITPFGNPQNMFLYSYFNIPTSEFFRIMFLPFAASTLLIAICCLFVKKEALTLKEETSFQLQPKRMMIYLVLFLLSILIVFRVLPYELGILLIVVTLFFLDRKALLHINFPLMLTFCVFFVFAGNMARIPEVSQFFHYYLPKSPLLFGALSCQVISNVPCAVLLSRFTTDYATLLVAVNIGGCGTMIASLASLITFSEFKKNHPTKVVSFIVLFSIINVAFLAILLLVQQIYYFNFN